MHRNYTRIISVILVFLMVFSMTAAMTLKSEAKAERAPDVPADVSETEVPAASEPEDESLPTDEELIAMYHIPNTWSRAALLFAVRNGLLSGTGDGTLSPTKTATRAEIATILASALPTKHIADLSAYTDLAAGAWYVKPLGRAVALGLISGTGNNMMTPNGRATREQAIVIIAKAFGLSAAGERELYPFKDWDQVSQWAVPSMAAMVKAGYVAGSNGCLNPKQNITRQEFAQIIYSIVDRFAPKELTETDGMTVTYLTEIPAGTVVNGDLLICNDATELNLEGITVTGRLILQGVDGVNVTISGCDISDLVLCRPATVQSDGSAKHITVIKGKAILAGTLPEVTAYADTVIEGTAKTVTVYSGDLTVAKEAQIEKLIIDDAAKKVDIRVDGTVKKAEITCPITLTGEGTVTSADVYFEPLETKLMPETVNYIDNPGLTELELSCVANQTPSVDYPLTYLTAAPSGVIPKGTYDLIWYINGEYVFLDAGTQMNERKTYRHQYNFKSCFSDESEPIVTIMVRWKNHTRIFEYIIPLESELLTKLSDVKTINVKAVTNYRANMYSNKDLTNYVCGVPKDTEVTYMEFFKPGTVKIKLPDGRVGYVTRNALSIPNIRYYTLKDYTVDVKEAWINQQGYRSSTNYLVWTNLYTQQINIFKGSKGNWKLAYTTSCATGCREKPTPQEVTQILYKSYRWDFDTFYVHHVCVFDSKRGFHSMLYNYDGVSLHDSSMGKPASAGCIRVPDEGTMYLWNNVPVGSTVVIY